MANRKILLIVSIIFCVIAAIAVVGGLWMYISSRQIPPEQDMYGESSGWGQIIGVLVFIVGIILAIVGVLGLVFNKKRYGGIYYIVAGALLISVQITPSKDIIGIFLLLLPMIYFICGILLLIHNSKKPLPAANQDACIQENSLAQE